MANSARSALLIIDSQVGLNDYSHFGPSRSNPTYESNISRLLSAFRSLAAVADGASEVSHKPVIMHVHHHSINPTSPLYPNSTAHPNGTASLPCNAELPGETVIVKSGSSAFAGTTLEETLDLHNVTRLFVAGMDLRGCVNSTVRAAVDLKFLERERTGARLRGEDKGEIFLVTDCTAAFQSFPPHDSPSAELVHEVTANNLRDSVTVVRLEEALELLGVAKE